jgi:hypothetical protein
MKGLGSVLTALIIGLSAHLAKTKIAPQSISKDILLMRLIHYSPRLIETLQIKEYDQNEIEFHCKPNGLWLSVEGSDDWKQWCKSEEFRLDRLRFSYEVVLIEEANILYLNTPEEIFEFSKKYPYRSRARKSGEFYCTEDTHELNWFEIKQKYQGIVVSPYQWECRLELGSSWYYPWDCSSGCIWDLNCVKDFIFLEEDLEVPDKPKVRVPLSTTIKKSMVDCVFFMTEDGHKEHEYAYCERTIMTGLQYLNGKRQSKGE